MEILANIIVFLIWVLVGITALFTIFTVIATRDP